MTTDVLAFHVPLLRDTSTRPRHNISVGASVRFTRALLLLRAPPDDKTPLRKL